MTEVVRMKSAMDRGGVGGWTDTQTGQCCAVASDLACENSNTPSPEREETGNDRSCQDEVGNGQGWGGGVD